MQGFSLEKMVGGVLADTRALMQKHANAQVEEDLDDEQEYYEDGDLAIEGEKLASALEYVADRLDEGDLTEDAPETSLEQIKQAYEIVSQIEADPRLKMKIAAAVGRIPKSPGMGKGIIPGKAPANALANDLKHRPGGGGQQPRSQAKAPGEFQIPHSPSAEKSIAPGGAPDALSTDLDDRPCGGASYPEKGVIRTKSAASKVAAWGKIMKTAGEFKHDPAKDQGNKSAKITGEKSQGPLGKPKGAHAWGEGPSSSLPSEIQTSRGARDYTKRQAKEHMAADLAKVLSHPAFSKKHDDVTSKNLGASEVSKLAGALGAALGAQTGTMGGSAINATNLRRGGVGPWVGGRGAAAGDAAGAAAGAGKGRRTGAALGSLAGSLVRKGLTSDLVTNQALRAPGLSGLAAQTGAALLAPSAGAALGVKAQEALQRRKKSKDSTKEAGLDKLASLANSELLDRVLRGEIDPDMLTKLADSVGPEGAGGVDASTGITINDASSGTVAPDDKAVAFRQALEQSARHTGERMHQSSDVVGMPGGSAGDSTTPAIPSY